MELLELVLHVVQLLAYKVIDEICGCGIASSNWLFAVPFHSISCMFDDASSAATTEQCLLCVLQDLAYVLATGYVAASILVSGFFIQLKALRVAPMRWISYLSYPRYAVAGIAQLELAGVTFYPPSTALLVWIAVG